MIRKGTFFFLLALDFASKFWAASHLPGVTAHFYPFGGIPVFSICGISFSLNCTMNTGAVCGLFPGHSGLLFGVRAVLITALLFYLLVVRKKESPFLPLWLIAIGAIGNAIDYWLYGSVIDFFHFNFWGRSFPIFNLADSYITLGALALLFLPRKRQPVLQ